MNIFKFSNRTYNVIKYVLEVVIPAFIVLYATVGGYWGWSMIEQVVGTIAAVGLFLGIALGISRKQYDPSRDIDQFDGQIFVDTEDNTLQNMAINVDPVTLAGKNALVLKVDTSQ